MTKPTYRVPTMREIGDITPNGFKAISTFSGCGGSSTGYKMAGFKILWANEFIPAAQDTYAANHPSTFLDRRDIRLIKPEDILNATGLKVGELDLFDGSPPCSSFSTAGIREDGWGRSKKYSDSEQRTDDLFFEYARLIEGTMPKVFVAENVKGLVIGEAKKVLGSTQLDIFMGQADTIYHRLCDIGYKVKFEVLDAADYGVPQRRNRVIFVGVRQDLKISPCYPRKLPFRYSFRDALPEVFETLDGGKSHPVFGNPEPETNIERFAIGREWDNIKPGEQSEKYFSLIKPNLDEPCPTVTATTSACLSAAGLVHPLEKRKLSIAELRRMCGFPDDCIFTGSFEQQGERLGRAVPPVMMSHIAANVRDEILSKQ